MAGFTRTDKIVSNTGGRCIEVLHHSDDPTVWIVRESKKILWFRWKSAAVWFFNEQQAASYARHRTEASLA